MNAMSDMTHRVTQEEVTALTLEALRLIELGGRASHGDWDAYRQRKIDILERLAADRGPFIDEGEAEEIRRICRREATALRLGLPPTWAGAQ